MQIYESITDNFRHLVDGRGMGPVRVVHRGECQLLPLTRHYSQIRMAQMCIEYTYSALQSCEHHVSSIQTMNKIRRESRALFVRIDLRLQVRVANIDTLQGRNELFPLNSPVGLDDREAHWRRPND